MQRQLLTDFELMILLAILRAGEGAYGGLVAFGMLVAVVRPEMLWTFQPAILGGAAPER